jgi:dTDP-4-dehydrorhamnose reductase
MKRQTILIIGASGLVGTGFIDEVAKKSKIDYLLRPTHRDLDVSDFKSLTDYVKKFKPNVIINFAAHRNANSAEEQRNDKKGSAWKTNVVGARNVAKLSKQNKIYLIHISTDMVFSGRVSRKGPYSEEAIPESRSGLLSWYGWTKRLAEKAILSKGVDSSIIRIGNVVRPIYDPTLDYVGKALWLYDQKKLYPVFDDQFLTLSYIPDIALVIQKLLKKRTNGVFHVASSDLVTPFEMVEYLLYKSRNKKGVVKKTSIDDFLRKVPNRYPKYGGLMSKETQKKLGVRFGTWRKIVDNFIKYYEKKY